MRERERERDRERERQRERERGGEIIVAQNYRCGGLLNPLKTKVAICSNEMSAKRSKTQTHMLFLLS